MWKYLDMKCWSWWIHTELCDYCSYNTANFLDQHVANWYISCESKSFSSKNFTYLMFLLLGHTYHQKILLKLLITINRVMLLHLVQKACGVLLFLLRITNVEPLHCKCTPCKCVMLQISIIIIAMNSINSWTFLSTISTSFPSLHSL